MTEEYLARVKTMEDLVNTFVAAVPSLTLSVTDGGEPKTAEAFKKIVSDFAKA